MDEPARVESAEAIKRRVEELAREEARIRLDLERNKAALQETLKKIAALRARLGLPPVSDTN